MTVIPSYYCRVKCFASHKIGYVQATTYTLQVTIVQKGRQFRIPVNILVSKVTTVDVDLHPQISVHLAHIR